MSGKYGESPSWTTSDKTEKLPVSKTETGAAEANVKLGKEWKVSVPTTETKEPEVNIAEFKTSAAAEGNFSGKVTNAAGAYKMPTARWTYYADEQPAGSASTEASPSSTTEQAKPLTLDDIKSIKAEVDKKTKAAASNADTVVSEKIASNSKDKGVISPDTVINSSSAPTGKFEIPGYDKYRQETAATAELDQKASDTEGGKKPRLTKAEKEIEARTHSDSMLGPEISEVASEEDRLAAGWEKAVLPQSGVARELKRPEGYEVVRTEWKEAREKALKSEAAFQKAYQKHLNEKLSGVGYYLNLPRRAFGIGPSLTPELRQLQSQSLHARAEHKRAAKNLETVGLGGGDATVNEKISARYQRKLSHHLTIQVYKERLKQQEKLLEAADQNSLPGKTIEKLRQHKVATIGAATLGAGLVVAYAPVLAARALIGAGVGLLTRGGVNKVLDRTYVEKARKNLKTATATLGDDYFSKSFIESDKEMERLAKNVGAREARAKTMGTVAGIAAGGTSAYYAGSYIGGLVGEGVNAPVAKGAAPAEPFYSDQKDADLGPVKSKEPFYYPDHLDSTEPKEPFYPDQKDADLDPIKSAKSIEPIVEPKYYPDHLDSHGIKRPIHQPLETGDMNVSEAMQSKVEKVIADIQSGARPEPKFQTPEVDLRARPHVTAPIDTPTAPEAMGDAKVSEAVQPEVEKGMADIKSGLKEGPSISTPKEAPIPEAKPDIPTPKEAPIPTPRPVIEHTVMKGDTTWDIQMSKSEVFKEMTPLERESALNKLLDYSDKNPEFAKEVGALKSGDLNKIYPGETIKVSLIDAKLRELLGMNVELPKEVPVPEARPENPLPNEAPIPTPRPEEVTLPNEVAVPESRPANPLPNEAPIPTPRPEAVVLPEEAPIPTPNPEAVSVAIESPAVKAYVTGVEKGGGFLFGRPDVSNTFAQLEKYTFAELNDMAANDNFPKEVNKEGIGRWSEEIGKLIEKTPAKDNETLGAYIARAVNARAA